MVIPLLLMFAFAGIEFSRSLKQLQIATAISREFASLLYRECASDREGINSDRFKPQPCFDQVAADLTAQFAALAPGAEYTARYYTSEGEGKGIRQDACYSNISADCSGVGLYDQTGGENSRALPGSPFEASVEKALSVVVAEVSLPYDSWVGHVKGYFSYSPKAIYAATII